MYSIYPTIAALPSNMDLLSAEAVEGTPSYPVNCSNFTSIQFWYLDLARGVTGAVSLLICSLILFLILLHKGYTSLLQRFLLYLALATWLTEVAYTMQIEHLVKYSGQRQFCITVAFLETWSSAMFVTIALEITLLLTYRVYKSLQRRFVDCNSWSKRNKVLVEVVAVALSIFLPLAVSVMPLIRGTYGLSGAWCWIISLNSGCKGRGPLEEDIQVTVYVFVTVVIGICIVFVIILFCISACQSSNSRKLNCKMIRDNVVLLVFYLIFFTSSSVDISAHFLLSTRDAYDKYPMWLVYAIGFPLDKLVLLLGILIYVYSFKNLTLGSFQILKRTCFKCCQRLCCKCCQQCDQRICHIMDTSQRERCRSVTGGPTYRSSHPQVYPSETVFSPPYTGAFTSITRRDLDSSEEGERKQLIPPHHIGYDSLHKTVEIELQRTC